MKLIHIAEPQLRFGYSQPTEDPRDGLMLFGPLSKGNVFGIRAGVVGTPEGIRRYKLWVKRIQSPISCARTLAESLYTPTYPGFQTVFQIPWHSEPIIEAVIETDKLKETVLLAERQQRVFQTVDLYASKILESRREDESEVDLWFVIVPDEVSRYCRPRSNVEPSLQRTDDSLMRRKEAKEWISEPSLFDEMNTAVEPFQFEPDFHNQLKAKLLLKEIPTQVVQESTLTPEEFVSETGRPLRRVDKASTIAWNLTTAAFYKASGRPWKLNRVRMGVCYLGLVFKRDDRTGDERNACCAAQMFLDSGDGVVFKGAVGPWYSGRGDYHLTRAAAKQVVHLAIESYKRGNNSVHPPSELFIHGRTRFNDEEWQGFQDAVGRTTQVVGVRIRQSKDLKLYSPGEYPIMRGSAYVQDARAAYLWTVGYTPRLQTYVGKEVPNPLYIEISRGLASIDRVCADVLALTKLNYNACIYGDGEPVTLKFADAVGEILTAAPFKKDAPPLPFKYYI